MAMDRINRGHIFLCLVFLVPFLAPLCTSNLRMSTTYELRLTANHPSDPPRRDSKPRVFAKRCMLCHNHGDTSDIPKHLPADFTTYVLTASASKSQPYHVTLDDVTSPPETSRLSRSPATNSYVASAGSSLSLTRPTGPDSSAPRGSTSSNSDTSGAISYSTGSESRHNTVRQTTFTIRCASAPHTVKYAELEVNSSSPPANPGPPRPLALQFQHLPPTLRGTVQARDGLW